MSGGTALVPGTLGEIHALRDAGDDAYWSAPVQAAELALVEEERRPERQAVVALERLRRDVGDWSTLEATFDELPAAVHEAVADELMSDPPIWPPMPSWEEIQSFKGTDAGRLCAREWGDQTGQKLATISARIWRIISALDDDDAVAALNWVDELEVDEAKAVLGLLAA